MTHEWPDGQSREEAPYRCGTFATATGEQCVAWSDHPGKHVFASDFRRVAARNVAYVGTFSSLPENTRRGLRLWAEMLDAASLIERNQAL